MLPDFEDTNRVIIHENIPMNEVGDILEEYVSADCWGLSVNDEVIFDSYQEQTIREKIQDNLIRTSILELPHNLLMYVYRLHEDSEVMVYMFGDEPSGILFSFSHERRTWNVYEIDPDY
jgi:hypothetical protein